jgi:O-methyltransferase involved in polyketide biosynthesis
VLSTVPDGPTLARVNRVFLVRAVREMTQQGIGQFLDLGSGLPTSPSAHEVAQQANPSARVIYVDHDPIVFVHNAARTCDPLTRTVLADLTDPDEVHRTVRDTGLFDLDRPVGLLLIAVLHFVDHDPSVSLIRRYRRYLPPGSAVALSCQQKEGTDPTALRCLQEVYSRTRTPVIFRTRSQIEQLTHGLNLARPGITDITRWRTRGKPGSLRVAAALGHVP